MNSVSEKELEDLNISNTISSPKTLPNLCDLPLNVVQMIVKNLDLPRRVKVSRVCKTLREIVNGLKPPRCNEIKITVGSEGCEMIVEGYSIKYEKPEEENEEGNAENIFGKMLDDLLIFVHNLQLPTFSIKLTDNLFNKTFLAVFEKCVPQKLKVYTLVVKVFSFWDIYVGPACVDREANRVVEYHYMEKSADDIVKVKVSRNECTGEVGDRWKTCTNTVFFKYFREDQENIYVDEPELLPPKNKSRDRRVAELCTSHPSLLKFIQLHESVTNLGRIFPQFNQKSDNQ
uniref:F-box domain-containing protein n=1 Tax=Caenorhabditis tropicalis TaxID=1561998 RepID=A0A1I7TSI5_9PELO